MPVVTPTENQKRRRSFGSICGGVPVGVPSVRFGRRGPLSLVSVSFFTLPTVRLAPATSHDRSHDDRRSGRQISGCFGTAGRPRTRWDP